MSYLYFAMFLIASLFLGVLLHIAFLKKTLSQLLVKVAKSFDLRAKQRRILEEVASDYFHAMPIEAHAALSALDRSLVEVQDAITYSELALESKSVKFIKEAIYRMKHYHRDLEENINEVNSEIEDSGIDKSKVRNIKATWEYKADEIIELLATHIGESSDLQRKLGYRVPNKTTFRKSTTHALDEVKQLSEQHLSE